MTKGRVARRLRARHDGPIIVHKPLDIVFVALARGLRFDELEIDLLGIFQTMFGADDSFSCSISTLYQSLRVLCCVVAAHRKSSDCYDPRNYF